MKMKCDFKCNERRKGNVKIYHHLMIFHQENAKNNSRKNKKAYCILQNEN